MRVSPGFLERKVFGRWPTYLNSIFVVGGRENLLENELSCPGHNRRVVSEVGMLEKKPVVFLVDANRVLDISDGSILGRELGVKVANIALAVTSKL